ncbi:restriction endonuclease subunit M [Psychrobacter pygoscelis]|uniref:restriction endonuclease subunit M n=1 Tax=Psychrobacter pygoscelis TaxID=2488563 RepID=UPI00103B7C21|nr:N-6 DNA methylase [Psychrobacter pygoscelis]
MSEETVDNYFQQGLRQGIIELNDEDNRITYFGYTKSRSYLNPEERVQAEIFCQLVIKYGYPKERIKCFVPVTMGSSQREADIVVYNDAACLQPHILVECKKQEVSEAEFKQAVEQAYSYAYSLPNNTKWIWVTSKIKNIFLKVDKSQQTREESPDIPAYGIKEVAPYKFVKYAERYNQSHQDQHFFDLSVVIESELTHRFKQAHNALWAGGQLNPSEAFDELDKLIFCKIWDERKPRKAGVPYDFQVITEQGTGKTKEERQKDAIQKTNNALYERVTALYEEGRKKDPEVFKDDIRLSPSRVRTIVEYLQDINLSETDLDSKGRAFETFMGSFFRGNFGQYFTPRPIVQFIADVLPIKQDDYVLDTSCGSGGFLLHALEKIRRQANEFYEPDSKEHWQYWHDFAEKRLFGIEINEQISRAAKMNMIIHDDGHTNVITADGLLNDKALQSLSGNNDFKYNHFSFILTNPPFGSSVKQTEKAYLETYNFGQRDTSWLDLKNSGVKDRGTQSTEVLFIEQCYQFLAPMGYLAIVLPDGVLTNSSLQYVRDQIEEWYRIVAVVSLPQTAFAATGAGVKSSVLFLRKYPQSYSDKLQEQKLALQSSLMQEQDYKKQINTIEKVKKDALNNPDINYDGELKTFKKTAQYKAWKTEKTAEYTEQIKQLKQDMEDLYLERKQSSLPDYPIFMAIAEDIGYDATGKPTAVNELDMITAELKRFISDVVEGETYE